ncbi:hypothetical protein INT48_008511 [Thamnidium elegans]|uniref:Swiss Army Knife RNA repair protein HAD domain-containing protein n=1 Tax=Thamnidium elegans TaxID=101142 RepID=A0A8H7SW96_9FUNG|nr:hypothetical protein INT48_008511 [Thamnidium elegans]
MTLMRMRMDEIIPPQEKILANQFRNSPYYTQQREPVTLDIFDFDSTLFLSPLLSCNLWHSSFIDIITTENLLGPGWWRDIRSLQVDAHNSQWKGFWNEDIVSQVKQSMLDPTHLTVLLTGRRYHPFNQLIESMLAAKGLQFDVVGLRPDPAQVFEHNQFMFNFEPNVFSTTMEFKTCFLVHMLQNVPTLKNIVMWDDRVSHIGAFRNYLKMMVSQKIIETGNIISVPAAKPKYNPVWELETVQKMISQHNDAIIELKNRGKVLDKNIVVIEANGQIISSANMFGLKKVPAIPILKLDDELSKQLKSMFEPDYIQDLSTTTYSDWELDYAEIPEYFGTSVLLVEPVPHHNEFTILARSKATLADGMVLQVQLGQDKLILPLWYKPSSFNYLSRKTYTWIPVPEINSLRGNSGYHELITVETL